MQPDSLYYDEVGVGGTISHVTAEYGNMISQNEKYMVASKDFSSELNHKIMKVTTKYLIPELKEFMKLLDKVNLLFKNLAKECDCSLLFRLYPWT